LFGYGFRHFEIVKVIDVDGCSPVNDVELAINPVKASPG